MSQNLIIEGGKITLPEDIVDRYQLDDDTPLKIIETRNGILLVPLTNQPMTLSLQAEIREWQELGAESFDRFPYEDEQ